MAWWCRKRDCRNLNPNQSRVLAPSGVSGKAQTCWVGLQPWQVWLLAVRGGACVHRGALCAWAWCPPAAAGLALPSLGFQQLHLWDNVMWLHLCLVGRPKQSRLAASSPASTLLAHNTSRTASGLPLSDPGHVTVPGRSTWQKQSKVPQSPSGHVILPAVRKSS